MSTSVIKIGRRNVVAHASAALFCIVFSIIYEHFSYGEYSWYMRCMFLFPLLGGAGAALIFLNRRVSCMAVRLWNSAIAVFTCGCLVHGIIAISGRSSGYDMHYRICGAVLAVAAGLANLKKMAKV